ncbi:diaminobutyrate acetyltransferase [Desulfobotulus sp. H1]|uniref:L-2,4-diaminobutyric acid acetyltransferase n=1 Tax=Desulfobotulus pelophilus TaxID=2823377 RepID=A0ABT3NC60_9BACT|nr:diaminobutyrate acetyltransferase [Desulfobotulus pelophilus]MCW7755047.1 diaminobutyrate acetyltransferase [Desulfobotulus pelophilus]
MMKSYQSPYTFRHPEPADGGSLWQLVKKTPGLDLNSAYYYIYFGHAFSRTSLIAEKNGQLAGFITGLTPPENPNCLFIWQVCVDPSCQGEGLGLTMLNELKRKVGPLWIEATITPSNKASIALFTALARHHDVPWVFEEELFPASCFGKAAHEPELLFVIGPLQQKMTQP